MTFVIADSGSTKTDWRIVHNSNKIQSLSSIGFNPVITNTKLVIKELEPVFSDITVSNSVEAVFYYGAGCWNVQSCSIILKALEVFFPNADISVTNDLIGAARAVCGPKAGIACILGTGANTCLYDGKKIVDNIPALGYIVGDEGSGAYLGKRLLQSYFYRELPNEIEIELTAKYDISKKAMLENVYHQKGGNRYLASLAKFVIDQKEHPFIHQLIEASFDTFVKRQILKYEQAREMPIHFIGSIAYFLVDILSISLRNHGLKLGNIIRQPIEGLVDFHKKTNPV